MSQGLNIKILMGRRKPDTYLSIPSETETEDLPALLLSLFGELREVITLDITPEKLLTRCTGAVLLVGIANKGYYLQILLGDCKSNDDDH